MLDVIASHCSVRGGVTITESSVVATKHDDKSCPIPLILEQNSSYFLFLLNSSDSLYTCRCRPCVVDLLIILMIG